MLPSEHSHWDSAQGNSGEADSAPGWQQCHGWHRRARAALPITSSPATLCWGRLGAGSQELSARCPPDTCPGGFQHSLGFLHLPPLQLCVWNVRLRLGLLPDPALGQGHHDGQRALLLPKFHHVETLLVCQLLVSLLGIAQGKQNQSSDAQRGFTSGQKLHGMWGRGKKPQK